ncbi:MAG TPA: hypothetical protein VE777_07375 [Gaiellales bacterium]|jgi:hypothetical protein|nr:hypothetical protein [Gaiellales bacterium]
MQHSGNQWFAKRNVLGVSDDGSPERVTIWIERKPGAVWAVGRAVDLEQRTNGAIRSDDYLFEGFEMGDALEAANDALAADLEVSRDDGRVQDVKPFAEPELLQPLERWFFGHTPQ